MNLSDERMSQSICQQTILITNDIVREAPMKQSGDNDNESTGVAQIIPNRILIRALRNQ